MSVQYELSTTLTTLVPRDNRMKREIVKYTPSEETSETSAREMNFWPLGAFAPPETSSGWEVDIWTRWHFDSCGLLSSETQTEEMWKENWEIRECCICIRFVTKLPHNIGEINELTGTDKLKLKIQSFDDKALKSDSTEFFKISDIIWEEILPNWQIEDESPK